MPLSALHTRPALTPLELRRNPGLMFRSSRTRRQSRRARQRQFRQRWGALALVLVVLLVGTVVIALLL
jgi:hypothetical protein